MPKRKMTPARRRQIAQWQSAGAKARRNGGIQKWSAAELASPRKTPKAIVRQDKRFQPSFWSKTKEKDQKELRIPVGKTIFLVHHTPHAEDADAIVKAQKFKPVGKRRTVYFTTYKNVGNFNRDYGKELVGVRVSRKLVKVDGAPHQLWAGDSVALKVSLKNLKGKKIVRVKKK